MGPKEVYAKEHCWHQLKVLPLLLLSKPVSIKLICQTESGFSETGITKFQRTCADKSRNSQILGINSRNPSESNPQTYRLSRLVNHKAVYFPKSPEWLLIFFSRNQKDPCPTFSAAPSTMHLHLQAQTNTMQTPINKHKHKSQKSCLVSVSYIPVLSARRAPPFSAWVGVGVAQPGAASRRGSATQRGP